MELQGSFGCWKPETAGSGVNKVPKSQCHIFFKKSPKQTNCKFGNYSKTACYWEPYPSMGTEWKNSHGSNTFRSNEINLRNERCIRDRFGPQVGRFSKKRLLCERSTTCLVFWLRQKSEMQLACRFFDHLTYYKSQK